MSDQTRLKWKDAPSEDIERDDLFLYLTPESIESMDEQVAKFRENSDDPINEYGTSYVRFGSVPYYAVIWYGSDDVRTYAKHVATAAFKFHMGFGKDHIPKSEFERRLPGWTPVEAAPSL